VAAPVSRTLKNQNGFTLLELLIVIIIIAILAILILPNVTNGPKKARDAKRITDLSAIQKSLEEYFVDYSVYPSTLSQLSAGGTPILSPVPDDPKNVSPYVYTYTPANSNNSYTLTACMENSATTSVHMIGPVNPCTTKTLELINNN
jgi:general secretion pathway protein G